MNKKNILMTSVVALTFLSATPVLADCGMDHKGGDMMKHEMKSEMHMDKDMKMDKSTVMGKGVVHSIDKEKRSVNITHEAIPSLKWPEMTMDLPVAEDVNLDEVTPEDEIIFGLELNEDKQYCITKITTPSSDKMMDKTMEHKGK